MRFLKPMQRGIDFGAFKAVLLVDNLAALHKCLRIQTLKIKNRQICLPKSLR